MSSHRGPCDSALPLFSLQAERRCAAKELLKMGVDETNGDDPGKAANGMNGGSVKGDNLKRSNSAVHHDGKGKDVIPLYRYVFAPTDLICLQQASLL